MFAAEISAREDQAGRRFDFVACRDWMCEPFMLAKTGKTIRDHQMLTIESYINVTAVAPWVAWMPVLQGWEVDDYLAHAEMYADAGINLRALRRVGVGSVCRRQATAEGEQIMRAVAAIGVRVHAFGVKVDGLRLYGDIIASADSMAWSFVARRRGILLDACRGTGHRNCANCMRWALEWRRTRIEGATDPEAMTMTNPRGAAA